MCKHKKSLAFIYIYRMISILENHVSLQAFAFLFVIVNSRRSDAGSAFFRRDSPVTNFSKFCKFKLVFRTRCKHRKYLFEKPLGPREHSNFRLSHYFLSFPLILSFIRLSLSLSLALSFFHSLSLSFFLIHSRILS